MTEVEWIATDPLSLVVSYPERRPSLPAYIARVEALLARDEGYTEVRWAGRAYPYRRDTVRGQCPAGQLP